MEADLVVLRCWQQLFKSESSKAGPSCWLASTDGQRPFEKNRSRHMIGR